MWQDYEVSADVTSGDDDHMGLIARYSSPASYSGAMSNGEGPQCSGGNDTKHPGFRLYRVDTVNTACTKNDVVAEEDFTYQAGTTYRIKLETVGGTPFAARWPVLMAPILS
ncbi:MAG: hypothetical protein ACI9MR_002938 [Myxococcota bacterium]